MQGGDRRVAAGPRSEKAGANITRSSLPRVAPAVLCHHPASLNVYECETEASSRDIEHKQQSRKCQQPGPELTRLPGASLLDGECLSRLTQHFTAARAGKLGEQLRVRSQVAIFGRVWHHKASGTRAQ